MSTTSPEPSAAQKGAVKAYIASLAGTSLEYYDFALYSVASALVFPHVFFPTEDPFIGLLLSFSTFAVGYFALGNPFDDAFYLAMAVHTRLARMMYGRAQPGSIIGVSGHRAHRARSISAGTQGRSAYCSMGAGVRSRLPRQSASSICFSRRARRRGHPAGHRQHDRQKTG